MTDESEKLRNGSSEHASEKRVHRENATLRRCLDLVAAFVAVVDRGGAVTFINKSGCRALGCSAPEEILGKNWFTHCLPEGIRDDVQFMFEKLFEGEFDEIEYYETPVVTHVGVRKPMGWQTVPLRDENDRVVALLSSGHDISTVKRAEGRLRESETIYRETLEALPDPIHIIDRRFSIVYMNPAFRRWNEQLGLDEDVVGRNFLEVFPFLPATVRAEYERVFADGKILTTRETNTIAGEALSTETRKIPIHRDGAVIQIVTVIRRL